MRQPVTAIIVSIVVIVAVIATAFIQAGILDKPTVIIGSASLPHKDFTNVRSLINRTDQATASRYDSLDFPRGSTFTVPANREFVVTEVCAVDLSGAAPAGTHALIGYGDDAVADSAAPPTNAVTLISVTTAMSDCVDAWAKVPAGKIPFALSEGSNWDVTASGVLVLAP